MVTAARDPKDRAALEGILSSTPLQSHRTYEYRALVPVVCKIADAMARQRDGREPLARIRLAGRLLGRCLDAPLRILGASDIPPHDRRIAQAYITAAAHAVELAAAYAKPQRIAPKRAETKARGKRRGAKR